MTGKRVGHKAIWGHCKTWKFFNRLNDRIQWRTMVARES